MISKVNPKFENACRQQSLTENTISHSQAFPHLDLHYTVFATDRQRKSENEVDFIVYMI